MTKFVYTRVCKVCGKVTDTWSISEKYFNFLKRSYGISFEGSTAYFMLACDVCAPAYYMSDSYKPPEPFKKKPVPVPPGLVIPGAATKSTNHLKVPK